MTTMGKYRHLSRCSTADGHFVVLAIDHRDNLLASLNQSAPQPVTDKAFSAFKMDVLSGILPEASGLLIDPAYGIGLGISRGMIPATTGLLAPIEVTNYDIHPSQRHINFIEGWSVTKAKRAGVDGIKLLLPYHPEAETAQEKQAIVSEVAQQCAQQDIPFFLEPIAYSLDPDASLPNDELRQIVVEMARLFSDMGVDVLKMQFPVDAKQSQDEAEWHAACEELNTACKVPWALLSAGVNFETFKQQARIACQAGASGVIVGRALWAEAVKLQGQERAQFLATTAPQRMRELASVCAQYAHPWQTHTAPPPAAFDWFKSY